MSSIASGKRLFVLPFQFFFAAARVRISLIFAMTSNVIYKKTIYNVQKKMYIKKCLILICNKCVGRFLRQRILKIYYL